ncbi:MAG: 50S ribosomal protein L11 methyltransferase, partial [Lachnospiraceae bacterium]|nr:50S ribosomal protein L11 methyltransferase [Lachnospiraceae bacterium]
MKWNEYTVHTTSAAEDLVVDALSEIGILGAEIRDRSPILEGDTMEIFKDVMPVPEEDDGKAEVVFYLEEDEDTEKVLAEVREALASLSDFIDIGEGTITAGVTEDQDWVNNWKEHFSAFTVDNILIKPTWVEIPADDHSEFMIEIDPGTAFGTGSHETTQLCIHGLRKFMKPG